MEEEWKIINLIGYEWYFVSSFGNIRNLKTNKKLKPTICGNDARIKLFNKDRKAKTFSIKYLVAITFCENINNYKYIQHIDGNSHNNNALNLYWSKFKSSKVFKSDNNTIPIYKFEKDYCINVETGKVYKNKTNKEILPCIVSGYPAVFLADKNNTRKTKYIHRIIMELYNPIENMENMIVDHIDGNRLNYNINNLRWVTSQQNSLFRKENTRDIQAILQTLIEKNGYKKIKEYLLKYE